MPVTISVTAETDAGQKRHMEDNLDVRLAPNETLKKIPALQEQPYVDQTIPDQTTSVELIPLLDVSRSLGDFMVLESENEEICSVSSSRRIKSHH